MHKNTVDFAGFLAILFNTKQRERREREREGILEPKGI